MWFIVDKEGTFESPFIQETHWMALKAPSLFGTPRSTSTPHPYAREHLGLHYSKKKKGLTS